MTDLPRVLPMLDFLPVPMQNPATVMVAISIAFTLYIGFGEMGGRNSGGSGWLTLFRISIGAVFSLVTAIVGAIFGGLLAGLCYLLVQILVCVVIPMVWLEKM